MIYSRWEHSKVKKRQNCLLRTAFQLMPLDKAAAIVKHENKAVKIGYTMQPLSHSTAMLLESVVGEV